MCRLAETIFKAVSLALCLPFLVVGALGFSLAAYWQVWPSLPMAEQPRCPGCAEVLMAL